MASPVTTEDVLDAARAVLRDEGVAGLSMRALAKQLGTSYQVVYSRVGGKADVVRALHDRAFHELAGRVVEVDAETGTRAHVHATAQLYLRHAVDDPLRFELMFGRPVATFERDEAVREVEWACFRRSWYASTRAYLDAHHPERERGTALRFAVRLWTAVHGVTALHLAGHPAAGGDAAEEVRRVVDLHLRDPLGVGAGPVGA